MDERPVEEISPDELRDTLAGESPPVFIDVRRPELYDESPTRIAGARRTPPDAFERDLPDLPRDRDIVIY